MRNLNKAQLEMVNFGNFQIMLLQENQKQLFLKEQQEKQKKIDERQEKLLEDHTIRNLITSQGHKVKFDNEDTKKQSPSSKSQSNHSQRSKKSETFKIVNVDWYESEIRKDIESKQFDLNYIKIEDYTKIYEQFQKLEDHASTDGNQAHEDRLNNQDKYPNEFVYESIKQILQSK